MKNSIVSWNKLVADKTAYDNSLREMFYLIAKYVYCQCVHSFDSSTISVQ